MKVLLYFLVFPGFLFTAVAGLIAGWVDRKITARLQWRVGPPWYQNFADIIKLLSKEVIVPKEAQKGIFLFAPFLGLTASTVVATILGLANWNTSSGFVGDLIVVWYFLAIPSLALILGGAASGNPLAGVGASREMKLLLSYELPFIIAILVVILKTKTLSIGEIINYQSANGAFITHLSGIIAFIVALLCVQAKLGLVPFDIPEAETELASGIIIEYSGAPLAVIKLTRYMLLFVLPVFLITLFWGGIHIKGLGWLWALLKYLFILLLITIIRNTNPRLRIDQAVKFFWVWGSLLAIVAVVLSILGA